MFPKECWLDDFMAVFQILKLQPFLIISFSEKFLLIFKIVCFPNSYSTGYAKPPNRVYLQNSFLCFNTSCFFSLVDTR